MIIYIMKCFLQWAYDNEAQKTDEYSLRLILCFQISLQNIWHICFWILKSSFSTHKKEFLDQKFFKYTHHDEFLSLFDENNETE